MKVFISWSGSLSKEVALLLHSWIEDTLQGIKAWISTDDISKGSLWFGDINKELTDTRIGIICLTRENMTAPWILFEAGSLSKGLSKNRVCPLLININHTDLKPPLSQFNGTLPNKEDMLKLIKTINAENRESPLSDERVQKAFDRWWDEFDSKFSDVLKNYKPVKEFHRRSVEDMVEEILQITRSLQSFAQQSENLLSRLPNSVLLKLLMEAIRQIYGERLRETFHGAYSASDELEKTEERKSEKEGE